MIGQRRQWTDFRKGKLKWRLVFEVVDEVRDAPDEPVTGFVIRYNSGREQVVDIRTLETRSSEIRPLRCRRYGVLGRRIAGDHFLLGGIAYEVVAVAGFDVKLQKAAYLVPPEGWGRRPEYVWRKEEQLRSYKMCEQPVQPLPPPPGEIQLPTGQIIKLGDWVHTATYETITLSDGGTK